MYTFFVSDEQQRLASEVVASKDQLLGEFHVLQQVLFAPWHLLVGADCPWWNFFELCACAH